jgi:hypothetical protein
MKLNLCMSFQLGQCLGSYTVGTFARFQVMTMKALAHGLIIESRSGTHSDIRVPILLPVE